MKIGDRVIGKKFGPLAPSNIIAITNTDYAIKHLNLDLSMFENLDTDELFFVCQFDKPIPLLTKKTFKESIINFAAKEHIFFQNLIKDENLFNNYIDYYFTYHVKKIDVACYPESDLELVHE